MTPLPWAPTIQRARKEYACIECDVPIQPGIRYIRQWTPPGLVEKAARADGWEGGTFRYHLDCYDLHTIAEVEAMQQ